MPANLSPEYKKAEVAFRAATTDEEKIEAIENMLAVIPKHKGTEKIQGDLKKRLSKLRTQEEKSGGKRGELYAIRREGAAQATLIGAPNCGKSLLVRRLTNAKPEVGDYPFTTTRPMPGMMEFEDIKIQLVDTGPVAGREFEPYHKNLSRTTDLVLLVADVGANDPAGDLAKIVDSYVDFKIDLVRELPDTAPEYGVKPRRALILANKYDLDEDDIILDDIKAKFSARFDIVTVSALNGDGIEEVRRTVFDYLSILRVYSKIPGKPPDMNSPFIMKKGSTVMDVARTVHKEIAEGLRYARIWTEGLFEGQMVNRDYQVKDKDIIELHV